MSNARFRMGWRQRVQLRMSDRKPNDSRVGLTRWLALVAIATLMIGGILVGPGKALAHTEFVGSDPANGATVTGALSMITLTFTNPANPAGNGLLVFRADGTAITPTSIDPTDGRVFRLNFNPGLSDGAYTVNWQVAAGDAHPIEGTFTFTVTGATTTPTTPPVTPATAPPTPTTVPVAPTTLAPLPTPSLAPAVPVSDPNAVGTGDSVGTVSSDNSAAAAGRIGRLLTFGGLIFSLGILITLAFVVRTSRHELRTLIGWAQLGGLAIAVGGFVELAALREVAFTSFSTLIGTKGGIAVLLKIVGGICVMAGLRTAEPAATAVATSEAPMDVDGVKWQPAPSAVGIVGEVLVLASFWFDGHTASRGPWAFHAAVNLVHVGAASAWAGGIFTLAILAWMRRGRAGNSGVGTSIARFSTIAAVSLAALAIAGVAMALMITDGMGQLFSTPWGKILVMKTVVVAVAAGIGAYNRFTLVPLIDAQPADPALNERLRTTLTIEAGLLVVVVALSAWLVGATV